MDVLPSGNIFRELQDIHDTGYFSAPSSLEDRWQQVLLIYLFTLFPFHIYDLDGQTRMPIKVTCGMLYLTDEKCFSKLFDRATHNLAVNAYA
ncbi:hypothetical protein QE152_g13362 [Popillia japonica]|uniref:Uncharacterized protein n=1 Tax=Popillia japonica TaxID=7064 RepID=A0AAW1LD98_POPJA